MELEIFIDPRHPNRYQYEGDELTGLRHFALKVDKIERLKRESSEVIDFGPIMEDWRGVRFCFLKDPDGLL